MIVLKLLFLINLNKICLAIVICRSSSVVGSIGSGFIFSLRNFGQIFELRQNIW